MTLGTSPVLVEDAEAWLTRGEGGGEGDLPRQAFDHRPFLLAGGAGRMVVTTAGAVDPALWLCERGGEQSLRPFLEGCGFTSLLGTLSQNRACTAATRQLLTGGCGPVVSSLPMF